MCDDWNRPSGNRSSTHFTPQQLLPVAFCFVPGSLQFYFKFTKAIAFFFAPYKSFLPRSLFQMRSGCQWGCTCLNKGNKVKNQPSFLLNFCSKRSSTLCALWWRMHGSCVGLWHCFGLALIQTEPSFISTFFVLGVLSGSQNICL